MKFTCSVDIKLPREEVIKLWDNEENMKQWQDGLQGIDHISGEKGKKGAVSEMHYATGKRSFELVETIMDNSLPDSFTGKYVHKAMSNIMHNKFTEPEPGITRWTADIDYIKFNSRFFKLMSRFMKGMFRKQTQKWLDQFKEFAEKKTAEGQAVNGS